MTGLYPDVPDARIPWDVNGTLAYRINAHMPVLINSASPAKMNSELSQGGYGSDLSGDLTDSNGDTINGLMLLFPQAMDLTAMWAISDWGISTYDVRTSADTTNGVDGTWTTRVSGRTAYQGPAVPDYRNSIFSMVASGVIALKITNVTGGNNGRSIGNLHVYGHPSADSDRLEFWHPTLDQPLYATPTFLDWAEVQRGTPSPPVKTVRIKNLASLLSANTITVSEETLTDAGNNFKNAHTFSTDGGVTFASTASIASLAPGQISGQIQVQYAPLVTDALSLHAGRIKAVAGSWA